MADITPSLLKWKWNKQLDHATVMSLFQYYLDAGGPLREMYEAFLEASRQERWIHSIAGLEAKEAARGRFDTWARAQPTFEDQLQYLAIEETATRFRRCQIGPLVLREASLDTDRKRSRSYYLAEVPGGKVRVCRAAGFMYHRPPGVEKDIDNHKDYVVFVLPEWLFSTNPLLTTKSNLPLVVMPDEAPDVPKWVKTDADVQFGLLERVWPVASIRPTPVCGTLKTCYE